MKDLATKDSSLPTPLSVEEFANEGSIAWETGQRKDSITQGLSSDGTWEISIPSQKTKDTKGKSKKALIRIANFRTPITNWRLNSLGMLIIVILAAQRFHLSVEV